MIEVIELEMLSRVEEKHLLSQAGRRDARRVESAPRSAVNCMKHNRTFIVLKILPLTYHFITAN